VKPPLDGKAAR